MRHGPAHIVYPAFKQHMIVCTRLVPKQSRVYSFLLYTRQTRDIKLQESAKMKQVPNFGIGVSLMHALHLEHCTSFHHAQCFQRQDPLAVFQLSRVHAWCSLLQVACAVVSWNVAPLFKASSCKLCPMK